MTESLLTTPVVVDPVTAPPAVVTPPVVVADGVTPPVVPGVPPVVEAKDGKPVEPPKETEVFKPYEVVLPQGVELNPEGVKAFSAFVNENKIPEATSKQLIEWYGKHTAETVKAGATEWQKVNDGWVATAKSDTEYGGAKFDTSIGLAQASIKKFGTPAFNEMLKVTGAGNHPEMIRYLVRVGNATKEDTQVTVGAPANTYTSVAKAMFPNQN